MYGPPSVCKNEQVESVLRAPGEQANHRLNPLRADGGRL